MPYPSQTNDQWWINDQTPDNPFEKGEDCEAFADYAGVLDRSPMSEMASRNTSKS